MNIFLSYANKDKDKEIAGKIAARLKENGHVVFDWRDPERRGKLFMAEIAKGIKAADAFLALLSPDFMESYWCQRELEMAMQRDRAINEGDPSAVFISVVYIGGVAPSDSGMLAGRDREDMSSPEKVEPGLQALIRRFPPVRPRGGRVPSPPPPSAVADEPVFRNRDEELHRVLNGLTSTAGPHFWLVTAPPQLGKTWLLQNIRAHDRLSVPVPWVVKPLDLRAQPAAARGDPESLLALMFGDMALAAVDDKPLRIAQQIIKNGRPHLFLLDSAELLTVQTASALREQACQIYRHLQDRGLRLALIVASRRDDGWKGVTPAPRLSPLALTQFNTEVVQQALHDLSAETKASIPLSELRNNATRVHRLTQGLPALLFRYLQWIRAEQWLGLERMETQDLFERLAGPYVRQELLTPASLLPSSEEEEAQQRLQALVETYRVLAPYRFFTRSHVRHHLESDADFRTALDAAGWSMTDLWEAIGGTALLRRPITEPWKEIHVATRRLLFRHFYPSGEQRAESHNEARKFVEVWAGSQVGRDQVDGLVECLWHEASAFAISNPAEMGQRLVESARRLSGALSPSDAFTLDELREFATERMMNDDELEEVTGDGLLRRLVHVVLRPEDA